MDILIDSNIIIYSILPDYQYLHVVFNTSYVYCSSISYVEVLGFEKITHQAKDYFEIFFQSTVLLPVSDKVIQRATELRQIKKMKLGYSLIASTALVNNLAIVTRNVSDFEHIQELKILNPIDNKNLQF